MDTKVTHLNNWSYNIEQNNNLGLKSANTLWESTLSTEIIFMSNNCNVMFISNEQ